MPKILSPGNAGILLTVSGTLEAVFPAKDRPGCVLELWNGRDTGLYYVPLPPDDCRRRFREKSRISFQVWAHAEPDINTGVIDTAGSGGRPWESAGSGAAGYQKERTR